MADLDRLRQAVDTAWQMPFPEHPAHSDELDDLMMELDELDGHLVGIAETVLSGGRPTHDIGGLEELETKFASVRVDPQDAPILEQCRRMLAYLREITEALQDTASG
ncbi:MAG TPA: hypothetical protein VIL34_02835 [Actinopolymorphaceae bacterium]|jgi:hypothetical protein